MHAVRRLAALGLAAALPGWAAAQDAWTIGVVEGPEPIAVPAALADAVAVSVTSPQSEDLLAAIDTLAGAPRVVLVYNADVSSGEFGSALGDGTLPSLDLENVLLKLSKAGTERFALLIDDCAAPAAEFSPPVAPPGMGFVVGRSRALDPGCGNRITDRFAELTDMAALDAAMGQLFAQAPEVARPGPAGDDLVALATRPGYPQPSIIVGIIRDPTPVAFEQVEEPELIAVGAEEADTVEDEAVELEVAEAEVLEGDGSVEVVGASGEISYDNLEARRALRDGDPELFATLIEAGAFDPPEAILAQAIQTEMKRMGCYPSVVDNIWGNGSRRSVTRYFDEIDGVEPETLEPTVELFRQIIVQDDVECPPPPQPVATSSGGGGGGTSSRSSGGGGGGGSATPRPTPTPPPPPPPSSGGGGGGGGTISTGNLTGVFR